jgi:hypothetical protein
MLFSSFYFQKYLKVHLTYENQFSGLLNLIRIKTLADWTL